MGETIQMGMKINGIDGTFPVPRLLKNYVYTKFDRKLTATMTSGITKTVDIKSALEAAWKGVVQRSGQKTCNEYFATLFQKKTLDTILNEGDLIIHCLEPKQGYSYSDLPDANNAGRDIGLDPQLFFDPDPAVLICTLIHELAHVGGASTDAGASRSQAHAAELALLSCSCKKQYRKDVVGTIHKARTAGGQRYA